jgi:hypothetical protein
MACYRSLSIKVSQLLTFSYVINDFFVLQEADNKTPLLCLLSTGSDPTAQIEALARNLSQPYQVSMPFIAISNELRPTHP